MIKIAKTTPNIELHVWENTDVDKNVLDLTSEVFGDGDDSNMMKIDRVFKELQDNKANKVNGKIPADELPSYVDDVLEFELYSSLPQPGEQGKIYVVFGDTTELNGQYRWTGTVYSSISNQIDFATKEDAEGGENNSKAMTALRSKELVESLKTKPNGIAGTDINEKVLSKHLPNNLMIYGDGEIGELVPTDADTLGGKCLLTLEEEMQQKADQAEKNAKASSRPVDWMPSAADVGGAVTSKLVSATLTFSGWSGNGPFLQTIDVFGLGATQNGDIGLSQSATAIQRKAAREAVLSVTGQAAESLVITADGKKPTTDIPVSVILLG